MQIKDKTVYVKEMYMSAFYYRNVIIKWHINHTFIDMEGFNK